MLNHKELLKARLSERAKRRADYGGKLPAMVTGWNPPSADGARWIESLDAAGLRLLDYADKITRSIQHTGWYTSEDGDNGENLRGVVFLLPAKGGESRYLAGYEDPNNPNTYRVDMRRGVIAGGKPDTQEDERARNDAAHAADSFAQKAAEEERNYNDAWQRGSRYASLAEQVTTARKAILALCKERRAVREKVAAENVPTICETLRDRVRAALRQIEKARKEREELRDANGWWIRSYGAAFNEGAGETVFEGVE